MLHIFFAFVLVLILYVPCQILDDIISGKVEEDPALLLRFLVISYADLKNWKVHYNVAFPSLIFNSEMTLLRLRSATQVLNKEQVMFLCTKYSTTWVSLFKLFYPLIFYWKMLIFWCRQHPCINHCKSGVPVLKQQVWNSSSSSTIISNRTCLASYFVILIWFANFLLPWPLSAVSPFFLVTISSDSSASVRQLKDWNVCQENCQKVVCMFHPFDN